MIGGKTALAIIPARGGSKRLPGKNIRPLFGKPLIAWTIDAARQSGVIDEIVVTTDDNAIAETARAWGVSVPWMRPPELASDIASSMDVVIHALGMLGSEGKMFDFVVLLQPTSPFRTPTTIFSGIEMCRKSGGKPVVAVSPARDHPSWCFHVSTAGVLSPMYSTEETPKRSQDLPPAYAINGSLYVSGTGILKNSRTFLRDDTKALIVTDKKEALDIDDEWDWMLAEYLCGQK